MSFEKNGMLTPDSMSDFDNTKKADYVDKEGYLVADKANKDRLRKPVPFCGPLGMLGGSDLDLS